jgi:hypothetical protein
MDVFFRITCFERVGKKIKVVMRPLTFMVENKDDQS